MEQVAYAISQPETFPRFDMYVGVHKGLRAFMSDTLLDVGRMDSDDADEVRVTLERVRDLLATCQTHLDHETYFVHPALEARQPGASARIAEEHVEHEHTFATLSAAVSAVEEAAGPARAEAALSLYRQLALFVGENFAHMHIEETAHNLVLWQNYSDEELIELHDRLVASIAPDAFMTFARWSLPYISHDERVGLLMGIRATAPAEVFENVMAVARTHLRGRDWEKLARALELPCLAGLESFRGNAPALDAPKSC